MGYNIHKAKNRPRDENRLSQDREDIIMNTEIDSINIGDGDRSYSTYSYRARASVDGEG